MGNATLYQPQSIRTSGHTDFVHRAIATVTSWFGSKHHDADVDTLDAKLRRDVGLSPVQHRAEPEFVVWLP